MCIYIHCEIMVVIYYYQVGVERIYLLLIRHMRSTWKIMSVTYWAWRARITYSIMMTEIVLKCTMANQLSDIMYQRIQRLTKLQLV